MLKRNTKAFGAMLLLVICLIAIFLLFSRKSEATSALPINSEIQKMLDYLGIENCAITKLPDYSDIHVELTPVTVTEQEVKEYVDEILEDYGKKALTAEFVKEEFDVDSIEDYYQKVREELKTSKEVEEATTLRNSIMKTLINDSNFSLNRDKVASYSIEIVKSYETEASFYDMSLDKYVEQELKMTKKEFYDMCYNEGEEYIKTYLVVGAIAEKEALAVTEKDIESFSNIVKRDPDSYSDESGAYIGYQILQNKLYRMFSSEN